MAASAWVVHDKAKQYFLDGTIDLDSADVIKAALFTDLSNVHTSSVDPLSAATNEVSGNGYAQQTLTGITLVEAAGVVTYDFDDPVFTASGGTIAARFAAIYNATVTSPVIDPIIASILLDTTPADVSATTGNSITIQIHADGAFTLS